MIIITAKVPRLNFSFAMTLLSGVCAFCLVVGLVQHPFETTMSSSPPTSHSVKNGSQRLEYLQEWGWKVEETPISTKTLKIPDYLDSSYEDYILLQTQQGFPSLEEFKGAEVIQYTYEVKNYPTGEEGVQVNLLCHNSQVIAGELLSANVNGFIHGLAAPDNA